MNRRENFEKWFKLLFPLVSLHTVIIADELQYGSEIVQACYLAYLQGILYAIE